MRRPIAKRNPHRDTLGVECIGDAASRALRALLVDIPAVEMLQRGGIHGDQRRMDDWAGVHQSAGQRVAAILDDIRERSGDHGSAWALRVSGNTPVGSRLARTVIAHSNGPCLRVSQGSVPVSAQAISA